MKIFRNFPLKTAEIISPLSIDDALFSLKNEVDIGNPCRLSFWGNDYNKKFTGYVKKDSFSLIRNIRATRAVSLPLIDGEISECDGGTRISITCSALGFRKIIKIIFYLLILATIALLVVYSFTNAIYLAAVFLVLLFCLISEILAWLSFKVSANKSIKKLKEIFCA